MIDFCQRLFSHKIPILAGPGGDRFVYDLRKEFDLFCKIVPFKGPGISKYIKREHTQALDILLLRENSSGLYQGSSIITHCSQKGRIAEQSFSYTEKEVLRFLAIAARLSARRKGKLAVILKNGGIPAMSDLWHDCGQRVAKESGIEATFFNIDYMAYYLIQHPENLDVIAAPNCFGDILGDLGACLLGSRALSYSGNFSGSGAAVYQTNHGCAYDLVGKDMANPVGHIRALAMLLQESFGLIEVANQCEEAIQEVWQKGFRTFDLMEKGCTLVGTREMGDLVAATLDQKELKEL